MARPRPRRALRPSRLTRVVGVAAPLALVGLATSAVVAFAALPDADQQTAVPAPAPSAVAISPTPTSGLTPREQPISRDAVRIAPTTWPPVSARKSTAAKKSRAKQSPATTSGAATRAVTAPSRTVVGTRYTTAALNLRTGPASDATVSDVVGPGTALKITGTVRRGYRYVVYSGRGRWVTQSYLSASKPAPKKAAPKKSVPKKSVSKTSTSTSRVKSTGGVTMARCPRGSAMESGLTPDAIRVHRSVCASFGSVTSFGGLRGGGGFHATGQAVDCMISDSAAGWRLANWVRANASRLGVSEVIYSRKIWTVQRSGEGWRSMSDRGSATANHYDHVHVSVYGHRGRG